jgi:cell division protein FtsI (penicillin-binding protein 3)
MTIGFGHGISVTPLQLATAGAALVNGGKLITPTFLVRDASVAATQSEQVIRPQTSALMRHLMVLNVSEGTAKNAQVKGYFVGGKTGSAEKVINGRYAKNKLLTSFLGMFPGNDPRYVVLVMLDEPKPAEGTHGYKTAGWNAVPTAGKVIERIAPILGLSPVREDPAEGARQASANP